MLVLDAQLSGSMIWPFLASRKDGKLGVAVLLLRRDM
jgi:hypothetical protein